MNTPNDNIALPWRSIESVDRSKKVMLLRKDQIYAGKFNKTIKNGTIYHFDVDGGQLPRRADMWAPIPQVWVSWNEMDPELAQLLVKQDSYDYDGSLSARPPSEPSLGVLEWAAMEIVPGMSEHAKQMITLAKTQTHMFNEDGTEKPYYLDDNGKMCYGIDPRLPVPEVEPNEPPEPDEPVEIEIAAQDYDENDGVSPEEYAEHLRLKEQYAQQQEEAKQAQSQEPKPAKELTAQEVDALYDENGVFLGDMENPVDEDGYPVNY